MNTDKRYCQNRLRKRKRTIVPSPPKKSMNLSPSEEERQFKLRRFVEDVGKFLSEKEHCSDQVSKIKISKKASTAVRKVTLPESLMNKRLLQCGGMQTQFLKRGVMTREMTARLDENLHKIISMANINKANQPCQCTQHCKGRIQQQTGPGSIECGVESQSSILGPLQSRSPPSEDLPSSPNPPASSVGGQPVATSSTGDARNTKSLSELDKELYPLIARVVSISCTKTKSKVFENMSYVSAVKRKLLQIYLNGMNENKQESSCLEEPIKETSSIGTSPFPSPVRTQSSRQNEEPPFKLAPAKLCGPSTMQYLEEKIGPSSTSSKPAIPSPVFHQSQLRPTRVPDDCNPPNLQYRQTTASLLSPPVVGYQRHQRVFSHVSKTSRYMHEPFLPNSPSSTPLHFKSRVFDGRGDGFNFSHINSFLPPIEEEEVSPDFRFFP